MKIIFIINESKEALENRTSEALPVQFRMT